LAPKTASTPKLFVNFLACVSFWTSIGAEQRDFRFPMGAVALHYEPCSPLFFTTPPVLASAFHCASLLVLFSGPTPTGTLWTTCAVGGWRVTPAAHPHDSTRDGFTSFPHWPPPTLFQCGSPPRNPKRHSPLLTSSVPWIFCMLLASVSSEFLPPNPLTFWQEHRSPPPQRFLRAGNRAVFFFFFSRGLLVLDGLFWLCTESLEVRGPPSLGSFLSQCPALLPSSCAVPHRFPCAFTPQLRLRDTRGIVSGFPCRSSTAAAFPLSPTQTCHQRHPRPSPLPVYTVTPFYTVPPLK